MKPTSKSLLSLKTVIRTKDFEASKAFYTRILDLHIIEEYNDGNGSRGIIVRFGDENSNAFFEISEITIKHNYYQNAFSKNIQNHKIDIQIRTDDVAYWAKKLKKQMECKRPNLTPLGFAISLFKRP